MLVTLFTFDGYFSSSCTDICTSSCSCGRLYKGETCRPFKIKVEEHRKAVTRGDIDKSSIAVHVWKNGDHLPLWDEVKIIDRKHHWKIRKLKEAAHMLGHNLLSRPSADMNSIWEPVLTKG
ncbi:Hypothetical predicted protein [Octopus vulgaris]|uniref:Uncharacterized protein n=1 Tax=Octopus vulgaris TaxID=6645 RepID=A0AA36AXW4_OCTVU|nr:Hypothetical predicted protein [Octopus vulgaris]